MKTTALLLLYAATLAALLASRASWVMFDGAWERLAIAGLGCLAGVLLTVGALWLVADYLARKGRVL